MLKYCEVEGTNTRRINFLNHTGTINQTSIY